MSPQGQKYAYRWCHFETNEMIEVKMGIAKSHAPQPYLTACSVLCPDSPHSTTRQIVPYHDNGLVIMRVLCRRACRHRLGIFFCPYDARFGIQRCARHPPHHTVSRRRLCMTPDVAGSLLARGGACMCSSLDSSNTVLCYRRPGLDP